jgi:hypothetical protein
MVRWLVAKTNTQDYINIEVKLVAQAEAMAQVLKYPNRARYVEDAVRSRVRQDREKLTPNELQRFFELCDEIELAQKIEG